MKRFYLGQVITFRYKCNKVAYSGKLVGINLRYITLDHGDGQYRRYIVRFIGGCKVRGLVLRCLDYVRGVRTYNQILSL